MTKARILIVEDEAIIASVIAGSLAKFDYEMIEIAASGPAAVAAALLKKTDLIRMDIPLQGKMDGICPGHSERLYPGARVSWRKRWPK